MAIHAKGVWCHRATALVLLHVVKMQTLPKIDVRQLVLTLTSHCAQMAIKPLAK